MCVTPIPPMEAKNTHSGAMGYNSGFIYGDESLLGWVPEGETNTNVGTCGGLFHIR